MKVDAGLDRCGPLLEAFSVSEGQEDAIQVHPVRVPREGQDEFAYVLAAMDTSGDAWSVWQSRRDPRNLAEVLRWMFRRRDDVASLWSCEE